MNTNYIKSDRLGRITLEYMAQAKNFFLALWEKAQDFFGSYRWREIVFELKTASIIISLIFAGLIIFLMLKMNAKGRIQRAAMAENNSLKGSGEKIKTKKWKKIEDKLTSDSPDNYKLAVLESGEIFEEVMEVLGKAAEIRIMNMEGIRRANEIKNKIIENSGFELNKDGAKTAIEAYKSGLSDLGMI